jgi:hypothetical protein
MNRIVKMTKKTGMSCFLIRIMPAFCPVRIEARPTIRGIRRSSRFFLYVMRVGRKMAMDGNRMSSSAVGCRREME